MNALNASARNWKPVFSVTLNLLKRPMFQFCRPGLWMMFRTAWVVLNVPAAGAVKIVDRQRLKSHACECYKLIDEKFSWLHAMKSYEHQLDVNYGWLASS